jgi:hypothetical protein
MSTNKKPATRLVIKKNKRVVDSQNHFTYRFEWYNNDQLLYREIRKLNTDDFMTPIEDYDVDELIDHKIICCLIIDKTTFVVDEEEI